MKIRKVILAAAVLSCSAGASAANPAPQAPGWIGVLLGTHRPCNDPWNISGLTCNPNL